MPKPLSPSTMSKDYQRPCVTGEMFVYVAMARIMVRRLARAR